MFVSVFRRAHFNAAHRLHNPGLSEEENKRIFGVCNNPNYHGHNYMLEVKVKGEIDPMTGYVIDTKILKDIIQREVHDKFDHRNLNEDTTEFKSLNPTAENIAIVIWNLIRTHIDNKYELSVRLYETENNFVEFDGK
ncbi:MAG TPA: 6-carboxytetrahydropterin synthase [Bacteroidia bacterium]